MPARTQGVIIGAGRGRRLMPYTREQPKCFAELAGQRILDWVLAALRDGGVDPITFVGGYRIADVKAAYPELGFRHNRDWERNNILASLLCAKDDMRRGFVSSYADIVYTAEAVRGVVEHPGDVVLAVDRGWRERYHARTEHPETDAEKVVAEGDRVVRVARDVDPGDAVGEFIGVAKFSERGAAALTERAATLVAKRGWEAPFGAAPTLRQAYLIDMIQHLVDEGLAVHVAPIDGGYFEIDTTQDYDIARAEWPRVVAEREEAP